MTSFISVQPKYMQTCLILGNSTGIVHVNLTFNYRPVLWDIQKPYRQNMDSATSKAMNMHLGKKLKPDRSSHANIE